MTAAMENIGDRLVLTTGPHEGRADEGRAARRLVREHAAKIIADPAVLDDIELMAAEAVANAVLHGAGTIGIDVATDGRRLRVEIRDEGPARRAHVPQASGEPAEVHVRRPVDHGRGLKVIDTLADEWALQHTPTETLLWFVVNA
jgi:anti-sigma regulatory factor (Ser/Thr protein kinase)